MFETKRFHLSPYREVNALSAPMRIYGLQVNEIAANNSTPEWIEKFTECIRELSSAEIASARQPGGVKRERLVQEMG